MPERSGFTQVFRVHREKQQVDLGAKLEEVIRLVVPDMDHMLVLTQLVRAGRDGCAIGEIASGSGAPKSAVKTAIERFTKLKLTRGHGGLLSRKHSFMHEGTTAELVVRLVKLWEHPQSHESVLQSILTKPKAGTPGVK